MERSLRDSIQDVAKRSGLRDSTVRNLLEAGWTFKQEEEKPDVWVSPSANMPKHVPHDEPDCRRECLRRGPHKHGLPCDIRCPECHGVCHHDCPAFKES